MIDYDGNYYLSVGEVDYAKCKLCIYSINISKDPKRTDNRCNIAYDEYDECKFKEKVK